MKTTLPSLSLLLLVAVACSSETKLESHSTADGPAGGTETADSESAGQGGETDADTAGSRSDDHGTAGSPGMGGGETGGADEPLTGGTGGAPAGGGGSAGSATGASSAGGNVAVGGAETGAVAGGGAVATGGSGATGGGSGGAAGGDGGSCPVCEHRDNAEGTCVDGACQYACVDSYADCDASVANGCETNLETLTNCGACGLECAAIGHGDVDCVTGECVYACDENHLDCETSDPECEALVESRATCGDCNQACAATEYCREGRCKTAPIVTEQDLIGLISPSCMAINETGTMVVVGTVWEPVSLGGWTLGDADGYPVSYIAQINGTTHEVTAGYTWPSPAMDYQAISNCHGIVLDDANNAYIALEIGETMTGFGGGELRPIDSETPRPVLVSLRENLAFRWQVENFDAEAVDYLNGRLAAVGLLSADYPLTLGAREYVSVSLADVLVGTFNPNTGEPIDVAQFGTSSTNSGKSVRLRPDGGLVIGGCFQSSIAFGAAATLTALGGADGFVARLGGDLSPEGAWPIGSAGWDCVDAVAAGPDDTTLVVGHGPITDVLGLELPSDTAAFVASIAPTGAALSAVELAGDTLGVNTVAADRLGRLYVGGYVTGPLRVGDLNRGDGAPAVWFAYTASFTPWGERGWVAHGYTGTADYGDDWTQLAVSAESGWVMGARRLPAAGGGSSLQLLRWQP